MADIVDDSYGPPHYYGSTIWDVFRPNPSQDKKTLQNIYGAGVIGKDINQVTEPRSPFGRLLQGVGIIGEPDARPMTDYEQMLYQEGKHYKSEQDLQTERERISNLQSQLNLAQDAIEHGQNPHALNDILKGLPEGMMPGFEEEYGQYQQDTEYLGQKRRLDLQGAEKDIEYKNYLMNRATEDEKQNKHYQELARIANLPMVKFYAKQYQAAMENAMQESDPVRNSVALGAAKQIHAKLVQAIRSAGGMPKDALEIAGEAPNELSAFGNVTNPEDKRTIKTPQDVDKTMGWMFGGGRMP